MAHSERYKKPETARSGVMQYLQTNRYWTWKGTAFSDPMRELNKIILGYFKYYGIECKHIMRSKKMISTDPACKIIQKDFAKFVEYLKTLKNSAN